MSSIHDIIPVDKAQVASRMQLTVRALLRNIILIGQLPRSATRAELLAAYDGEKFSNLQDFYCLIPRGFAAERDLKASDVEGLSLEERVAFLKGASLLLGNRLRKGDHCICHMPSAVILPVATFASILREDVGQARKVWKAFAQIPRLCAERLHFGPNIDLRRIDFEEFINKLAGEGLAGADADLANIARASADQMGRAYRLS